MVDERLSDQVVQLKRPILSRKFTRKTRTTSSILCFPRSHCSQRDLPTSRTHSFFFPCSTHESYLSDFHKDRIGETSCTSPLTFGTSFNMHDSKLDFPNTFLNRHNFHTYASFAYEFDKLRRARTVTSMRVNLLPRHSLSAPLPLCTTAGFQLPPKAIPPSSPSHASIHS